MTLSIIIMVCSAFLAAFSQVLLKISANKKYKNFIREYFNFYVISGYGLLFFTMFMNIIAYSGIQYKLGPILISLSYVFVAIFSTIFLNEKMTKNKLLGLVIIIAGVIIFDI